MTLRPTTRANFLITATIAAPLCVLLFLFKGPLAGTYVGILLYQRGWVQYAIMGCVFWSLGILSAKLAGYFLVQKSAFRLPLTSTSPSGPNTDDAGAACRRLVELHHGRQLLGRRRLERSLLFARTFRALDQVAAGRKSQDVTERLQTLADADASAVDSSYATLKVLVWAVPILGFIGTVLGIGDAVTGFSDAIRSANDLEVIKRSLGEVTAGLAVAFDTTLLALLMSILIMLPMSSLQVLEENLLGQVDDYVSDRVLAPFRGDADRSDDSASARGVEAAITRALAVHEAEFRRRAEDIRLAGEQVVHGLVRGWDTIDQRLQAGVQHQAAENARTLATVRETAMETQRALAALQLDHAQRVHDINEFLVKSLGTLQGRSERSQEQLIAAMQATLREVASAAAGAASTNRAGLDELRHEGQQTLTLLGETQERLLSNTGEHLARFLDVGRAMVASLQQAAADVGEQARSAAELSARLHELQASQATLATNLDVLARASALQDTLGGVQQALQSLAPPLSRLAENRPGSSAPRRMWFFRS